MEVSEGAFGHTTEGLIARQPVVTESRERTSRWASLACELHHRKKQRNSFPSLIRSTAGSAMSDR